MQFMGKELCDFCFEPLSGNEQCGKCGFTSENYKYLYNKILVPGTVLLGKYIIGRVLEKNITRVSYLALMADSKKTVINEYLPSQYVNRALGDQTITVIPEYKEHFFKGASEFTSSEDLCRIGEPFFANGTVYTESEYRENDDIKDQLHIDKVKLAGENLFESTEPKKEKNKSVLGEPLSADICFYEIRAYGYTDKGPCEGAVELTYRHREKKVAYVTSSIGEGVDGKVSEDVLDIPQSIATVEGLASYISQKRPDWSGYIQSYMEKRDSDSRDSGYQTVSSDNGSVMQDIFTGEDTARKKDKKKDKKKKRLENDPYTELQAGEIKLKNTPPVSKAQARYTNADGIVDIDEKIFVPDAPEHSPDRTAHPFVEPTEEIKNTDADVMPAEENATESAVNTTDSENFTPIPEQETWDQAANNPEAQNQEAQNQEVQNQAVQYNLNGQNAVYVSPEMVSRMRSELILKKKKERRWLFPTFLAISAIICAVLVVLIFLNM